MNFKTTRRLKDNRFGCDIQFQSYGVEGGMTAEEEQRAIESFGAPEINRGGKYVGKYTYNPDTKTITEDENGDEVSFVYNPMKYSVDSKFIISCLFDLKDISAADCVGHSTLITPILVAEAQCLLFENTIKARLKTVLDELRSKRTEFDRTEMTTFTA